MMTTQARLSDEATDAFTDWMETAVLPHVVPRDEYREILSRMDVLESRMDGLESRMDGLERAVAGMRTEFREELHHHWRETRIAIDGLRQEMNGRFDQMDERFDRMYERVLVQTRWMISSLVVIGALVTFLLTIGMFVK